MVFLNPAVLFGLAAAAIPVVLHFLNLQKLKRIEFSTLSFLKELQKTKIKRVKFKQWLLMALRVLLILLLVSAFARPTLETFTISGTSAAKTSAVFVIDDSYSMSVVKGEGSYFNKAKEIIKKIISGYQQGDEVAVVFSTANKERKFSTDLVKQQSEVNNNKVSSLQQNMTNAIQQAGELLNSSNNFNKELFILSDFSRNDFMRENLKLMELDENTKVYLFDLSENNILNRTVTNFELNNQILELDKTISFSAEIKNTKGPAVSNGLASLFINGKRSAQQSFRLEEAESKAISFESVLNQSGVVEAFVEIEQDDVVHDNRRYTSFLVPDKINILLAADTPIETKFIKLALQSISETTTEINEINLSGLTRNRLLENDLAIIIGAGFSSTGILKNYLAEGGRIILFPSSSTNASSYEELLGNLGIRTELEKIGEQNSTETISFFGDVEYGHPIFQNLFEDREDTQVESPEIYSYFRIQPNTILKPVIKLRDNSLFLSDAEISNGKILIFNSAPLLSWSNFPVKSLFAPLISKGVLYQTMRTNLGEKLIAGEEINIEIKNLELPQIKVVKPDNTEEFININEADNGNYLNYSKTEQLGIYKFYSGDKLLKFVSINCDPVEMDSEYMTEEQIEESIGTIIGNPNMVFIDTGDNFKEEISQARFGTELWRYFLLAAFVIALIEMFVSKNSKKDFAEFKK